MDFNWKSLFGAHEEQVAQIGVVGLSFTANKVYAAYLVREMGKLKILFMASKDADSMEARERALKEIVEEYDLVGQRACIVLCQNEYKLTMIDTPPDIDEDDIQGSIADYVEDYLDYKIDNTSTDIFHIPFKRSNDGKKVSFLVSIDLDFMKKLEKIALKVGLALEAIDIPELIFRDIMSLEENINKGFVLTSLNEVGGNAYIYYEDSLLMSRNINTKVGIDLSNFLLTGEKIITEEEYDETLNNLATYVQRTVDYCNGVFKESHIDKVVYLPSSTINIDAIKLYLDQHLGLTSHVLDISSLFEVPDQYKEYNFVEFLPVIGIALGNLEDNKDAEN